jgi:hypothetical protein
MSAQTSAAGCLAAFPCSYCKSCSSKNTGFWQHSFSFAIITTSIKFIIIRIYSFRKLQYGDLGGANRPLIISLFFGCLNIFLFPTLDFRNQKLPFKQPERLFYPILLKQLFSPKHNLF